MPSRSWTHLIQWVYRDLEAVVWLEAYLSTYNHILVITSHSQDFMDSVRAISPIMPRIMTDIVYIAGLHQYYGFDDEQTIHYLRRKLLYLRSNQVRERGEFVDIHHICQSLTFDSQLDQSNESLHQATR
jgi:hypothetical protein